MDLADKSLAWVTEWADAAPAAAPKTRRGLPSELAFAIDLERLWWTMDLKGLPPEAAEIVPRPRRLGVRIADCADGAVIGIGTAIQELERLRPAPRLLPADASLRRRAARPERWLTGEIARCVLWHLLQPLSARGRAPWTNRCRYKLRARLI
ncbi:MAG: hypothetical protein EXR11_08235 [Rhodospirillaceae bacterium]|nr:hypothetical protein [Rhodospirillaceae bacterium]